MSQKVVVGRQLSVPYVIGVLITIFGDGADFSFHGYCFETIFLFTSSSHDL